MQTEETQFQQKFEETCDAQENINAAANDADNAFLDENVDAQNEQNTCECKSCECESCECEPCECESCECESSVDVKALMTENEQLKAQIEALANKHKDDTDLLKRALAESENQKKRIEADVEREKKYGNEKILKALLPVVDSLELALKHSNHDDPAVKPTIEGVQNTVTLLLKELSHFGVEVSDPEGLEFDPNIHQAISMVPSAQVKANHVLSVMQKGYILNGRVVRPAMVIVSSGAPASTAEEDKKNSINIEA